MTPGSPRDIRPENFHFGVNFRSWVTGRKVCHGILAECLWPSGVVAPQHRKQQTLSHRTIQRAVQQRRSHSGFLFSLRHDHRQILPSLPGFIFVNIGEQLLMGSFLMGSLRQVLANLRGKAKLFLPSCRKSLVNIWLFCKEIWREFCGIFPNPQNKGSILEKSSEHFSWEISQLEKNLSCKLRSADVKVWHINVQTAHVSVCAPLCCKNLRCASPFLHGWRGSCGQQIHANVQGAMQQMLVRGIIWGS